MTNGKPNFSSCHCEESRFGGMTWQSQRLLRGVYPAMSGARNDKVLYYS